MIALLALFGAANSVTHADTNLVLPAFYPEGAYWHGGKLYYAEMGADDVKVIEGGAPRVFFAEAGCGPTALAEYGRGFLVLCHLAGEVVEVDGEGVAQRRWSEDDRHHALRDPNDGFADGHGGVYFSDPGVFSRAVPAEGYVMHLDAEGRLARVAGPLWYPNGVLVDRSRGRVFVTEHMSGKIYQFHMLANGRLSERRVFVNVRSFNLPSRYPDAYAETGPDGLDFAPGGDIYVAIYGGGRFLRIAPDGRLVGEIDTEPRYITNISFDDAGGAYTTGSFENESPPYPGEVRYLPPSALTRAPD